MNPRAFAIVPAAGHSVRMGRPKLLIDLAGKPLIRHVLDAWRQTAVERIVVVMRKDDAALAEVVRAAGAEVVQPAVDPPDMKASIRYGLEFVAQHFQPQPADVWLVAPGDMPGLSPAVIGRLLQQSARQPGRILIPTIGGRRGHPVLLPWSLAAKMAQLDEREGLNTLIDAHDPLPVACDDAASTSPGAFVDLDTPADLKKFRAG